MKLFISTLVLFSVIMMAANVLADSQLQSQLRGVRLPNDPPANEDSVFAPGVALGQPIYSGTGCPQGSISTTLSPDLKTLSLLFDQFQTIAGQENGLNLSMKNCRIRIPVRVSAGFQVAVVKTDFRGFNDLPSQANARITTVHSMWVERRNQMVDKKPFVQNFLFQGPVSDEFLLGTQIEDEKVWSPCGQNVAFNVGVNVQVKRDTTEDAISSMDSLDVQGSDKAVKYHLKWQICR